MDQDSIALPTAPLDLAATALKFPDQVVIPMASGSLLTKIGKATDELMSLGTRDRARCFKTRWLSGS